MRGERARARYYDTGADLLLAVQTRGRVGREDGAADLPQPRLGWQSHQGPGRLQGLSGFGSYHLSTADGRCLTQHSLTPNKRYRIGNVSTALPTAVKLATGPITVAGVPRLDAKVSSLLPDAGTFFALSVGTTPLDAKIVQNNTMPLREQQVVHGVRRWIELPGVAVDVPAGKSLFLTVSPVADMYAGQNGRVPSALTLTHATLSLHRTQR